MSEKPQIDMKRKKVGVLMGGESSERQVSLNTGTAILNALIRKGYQAVSLDMVGGWGEIISEAGIDVAFIALHGGLGEDGAVQGLLEVLGIPYTGSGVAASALAMSKVLTKMILSDSGVKTPDYVYMDRAKAPEVVIPPQLSLPLVVKPDREGSTIGIAIVKTEKEFGEAIQEATRFDSRVIIEKYIAGREITVGIVNGLVLPAIEIVPSSGFYDYRAKYTKGATEYICPAPMDEKILQPAYDSTSLASRVLHLRGGARLDFRVGEDGNPYFLEINTIPGMTETSLLPKAAKAAGMGFDDLVEAILLDAETGK